MLDNTSTTHRRKWSLGYNERPASGGTPFPESMRRTDVERRTRRRRRWNQFVQRPYRPITLDRNGASRRRLRYQSGYFAVPVDSSWRRRCGAALTLPPPPPPSRLCAPARPVVERNQFLLLRRREHNDNENERKREYESLPSQKQIFTAKKKVSGWDFKRCCLSSGANPKIGFLDNQQCMIY